MSNKSAKSQLICNFGSICFLNGVVTRNNPLTYHHCQRKSNGGKATYENGALLCRLQHSMFHTIESDNKKVSNEINDYFQYFKETQDLLAKVQMGKYVYDYILSLGYEVCDTGKILTLKRRFR